MEKQKRINVAIVGYGNLGRACVEQIFEQDNVFNLVGAFSKRDIEGAYKLEDIEWFKEDIDVVIYCGGSKNDAEKEVPWLNKKGFHTVDSFDTHIKIASQEYQKLINDAAKKGKTTAIIGAGWDPGLLSILRILFKGVMPKGKLHTFFGGQNGGLSQGHSNALKGIEGVKNARQLTVTREDAITAALSGRIVPSEERHKRVCYIVAESGQEASIEQQIRNMPGYFKDQQVEIHFQTDEQFNEMIAKTEYPNAHSGRVISADGNATIDVQLNMKDNPHFTANAMLAFARANYMMQQKGLRGAFTIDEVAPAYLVSEEDRLNNI